MKKVFFLFLITSFNIFGQIKTSRLDSIYHFNFSNPKDSIPYSRVIYKYDKNNNVILYLFDKWSKVSASFYHVRKNEYAFDENRNRTLSSNYIWNESKNNWEGENIKYESSYNLNGNKSLEVTYYWNIAKNDWEGEIKSEYSYNENGKTTLIIANYWNTNINNWSLMFKKEYTYDINGNQTSLSAFNWNSESSKLILSSKSETQYIYDVKKNIISKTVYNLDIQTNKWNGISKNDFEFDTNNKVVLLTSYYWIQNSWQFASKSETTYNANGNPTLVLLSNWDLTNKVWYKSYKDETIYDSSGNKILSIAYRWDDNQKKWITASRKYEYAYNSNNKVTLYAYSYLQSGSNIWKEKERLEYQYNINGNQVLRSYYFWTDDLIGSPKEVEEYDDKGNIISRYGFIWNTLLNDWEPQTKYINKHDADKNLVLSTYYDYDLGIKNWQVSFKSFYYNSKILSKNAYLSSLKLSEGTLDIPFDSTKFVYNVKNLPKIPEIFFTSSDKNAKVSIENATNILSEKESDRTATIKVVAEDGITTQIYKLIFVQLILSTEPSDITLQIYPNPSTDKVIIKTNLMPPYDLRLNNISGQEIIKVLAIQTKEYELSLQGFAKGVYILEFSNGTKVFRTKVVKQ